MSAARPCRECDGTGMITLEPVNPGGCVVMQLCDCQPVPAETDQEYWTRKAGEDMKSRDDAERRETI